MPLATEMISPVRCTVCQRIYDLSTVQPQWSRWWTAPCCQTTVGSDQADYIRVRVC